MSRNRQHAHVIVVAIVLIVILDVSGIIPVVIVGLGSLD